jgi:hypothetical protein
MLYVNKETSGKIAAKLINIGEWAGADMDMAGIREKLRPPIFGIVNILIKELGLGGELDEKTIDEFENLETKIFPRLFRQAVLEKLDNVLVKHSDCKLLNPGYFSKEAQGEYIVFEFMDDHPRGCMIKIGPFTGEDSKIYFELRVPKYLEDYDPYRCGKEPNYVNYIQLVIEEWDYPLNLNKPLENSYIREKDFKNFYNEYIDSFSFDAPDTVSRLRRSYRDIAFSLGQRAKFIFEYARTICGNVPLTVFIERLAAIDKVGLYEEPWELDEDGERVYL